MTHQSLVYPPVHDQFLWRQIRPILGCHGDSLLQSLDKDFEHEITMVTDVSDRWYIWRFLLRNSERRSELSSKVPLFVQPIIDTAIQIYLYSFGRPHTIRTRHTEKKKTPRLEDHTFQILETRLWTCSSDEIFFEALVIKFFDQDFERVARPLNNKAL